MKVAAIAACAIGLSSSLVSATEIYVDGSVTSSGNGLSWGTAKKYLSEALLVANSGDEIWIAAGTYYPDESDQFPNGTGN